MNHTLYPVILYKPLYKDTYANVYAKVKILDGETDNFQIIKGVLPYDTY